MNKLTILLLILLLGACQNKTQLYNLRDNKQIGIDFSNDLAFDNDFNVYKYRNFNGEELL